MALGDNFLRDLSERLRKRNEIRENEQKLQAEREKLAKLTEKLNKAKLENALQKNKSESVVSAETAQSIAASESVFDAQQFTAIASEQHVNATKPLDRRSLISDNFSFVAKELILNSTKNQTDKEFEVSLAKLERDRIRRSKAA